MSDCTTHKNLPADAFTVGGAAAALIANHFNDDEGVG